MYALDPERVVDIAKVDSLLLLRPSWKNFRGSVIILGPESGNQTGVKEDSDAARH